MTAASSPRSIARFFAGRSNRREFWLSLLALFAGNFVFGLALDPVLTSAISLPVWVVIASRRLHDFGQTGWWSLIPFVAGFVIGLGQGLGLGLTDSAELLLNVAVMLVTASVIGLFPGTRGANRFGAEPGSATVS